MELLIIILIVILILFGCFGIYWIFIRRGNKNNWSKDQKNNIILQIQDKMTQSSHNEKCSEDPAKQLEYVNCLTDGMEKSYDYNENLVTDIMFNKNNKNIADIDHICRKICEKTS